MLTVRSLVDASQNRSSFLIWRRFSATVVMFFRQYSLYGIYMSRPYKFVNNSNFDVIDCSERVGRFVRLNPHRRSLNPMTLARASGINKALRNIEYYSDSWTMNIYDRETNEYSYMVTRFIFSFFLLFFTRIFHWYFLLFSKFHYTSCEIFENSWDVIIVEKYYATWNY